MHQMCDVAWEHSGSNYGKVWADTDTVIWLGSYVMGLQDCCISEFLYQSWTFLNWLTSVLTCLYIIVQLVIGRGFF